MSSQTEQHGRIVYSRKMFGFNITPEAIVGPITMLGATWVVKTKFYT